MNFLISFLFCSICHISIIILLIGIDVLLHIHLLQSCQILFPLGLNIKIASDKLYQSLIYITADLQGCFTCLLYTSDAADD